MAQLLVEVVAILMITSGCGWLLRRLGQPTVVGEITGGLLLGPLVFGQIAPTLHARLFPVSGLSALQTLSQVGLVLFLFMIGAELELDAIRRNVRTVAATTAGSMLLPFAFGVAVAPLLWHRFASLRGFPAFAFFVGIAMSITALPVLASLLRERAQSGRAERDECSSIALLSASVNDLLGWCALSSMLILLHGTGGLRVLATHLGLLLLFVAAMLFVLRPLLRWLASTLPFWITGMLLVLVAFLSSQVTEGLGLHAFAGAFLAGLCVPRSPDERLTQLMQNSLRPVIRFTLPFFFALTGLRMQPGLFRAGGMVYLLLVVALAVTGKIVGAAVMARSSGLQWYEALRIGLLLNTRGLVELIVLDVGYREGVLDAGLFTLFVLMALLTTAMTAPLLDLHHRLAVS